MNTTGMADIPPALSVTGIVSLAGGHEHPCRAEIVMSDRFEIATPEAVRRGEPALCRLEGVGLIPGRVDAPHADGFTLVSDLCGTRRERVEARLAWLAVRGREGNERRSFPRIVPIHRAVPVRLPDGYVAEGEIEDLSKSGARIRFTAPIEASRLWQAGMQVTVGKRYAIVVRTEPETMAVRFRLPLSDETFNPSVVL